MGTIDRDGKREEKYGYAPSVVEKKSDDAGGYRWRVKSEYGR